MTESNVPTLARCEAAVELIEKLLEAVKALQGMCGWEPPCDSDHAEWLGCEMVASDAVQFLASAKTEGGVLMTNDQCQERAQSILDNTDHQAMEAIAKRIVETWSKEDLVAYAVVARMQEYLDGDLSAIENTLMRDMWKLDGGA